MRSRYGYLLLTFCATSWAMARPITGAAAELTTESATAALHRAVTFFRQNCSAGGGYVYKVSSDLTLRQGEVPVTATIAWLEPPATPAIGMAYLNAYRLTRDPMLLEAARETATALMRGQLVSGGWDVQIEFDPAQRSKYAYRVDAPQSGSIAKRRNSTTFDDNKSQSAARFLMQLDHELEFQDAALHEAVQYALNAFVQAQYPNGAWPQQYTTFPAAADFPVRKANFPGEWPREYPAIKYTSFYTLNDSTISDLIATMLDAWDIYQDARYLNAAKQGGDFFLLAQLPEPQPGWAQQYNVEMQPVWARKFEPPALTGSESQRVMQTLILLYRRTGDRRYLEPIPRALEYYKSCLLPDGQLARFYEIGTNKPLYFTRDYVLTYSDADMPTHYGFKVSAKLDAIDAEYQRARNAKPDELWRSPSRKPPKLTRALTEQAQKAVATLDERGAWVEPGEIAIAGGGTKKTPVIDSRTFIRNLESLAEYIAASR